MATHQLFNESLYLELNPDVRLAVQQGLIEARSHFEQFGQAEGRTASYLFNPNEYLALYSDVAQAVAAGTMNVYQHFTNHGIHEGRVPFAGFDVDHYLASNADVAQAVGAGLIGAVQHFMEFGYAEIRNFNPAFDIHSFLEAHPYAALAIQMGQISPAELAVQHFSAGSGGWNVPGGSAAPGEAGDGTGAPGGGGAGVDAAGVIFAQIVAMLKDLGITAIDANAIQKLVLESGLADPANLKPDGSGLIDPQPLVELFWNELYGANPFELIGNMPAPSGFADLAV